MRTFNAYKEADKIRQKRQDYFNWLMGRYNNIAVAVAIENNFAKKSKAKYIDKPFFDKADEDNEIELTDEEIDAKLREMIANEDKWVTNFRQRGLEETKI